MKKSKKIITAILTISMLASTAITAHAAPAAALDNVTVHDWDTPAAFAGGTSWPITTWYFYSQSGKVLGSIPNSTVMELAKTDPSGSTEWERWLADAFNEYRENGGRQEAAQQTPSESVGPEKEQPKSAPPKPAPTEEKSSTITAPAPSTEDFDAESLALEVVELTNAQRESHGLEPLAIDEELMELAQTRAKEVSRKYSHERPDGTTVVILGCGENVGARATAEKQVDAWMDSEGHRHNILLDWYESIGVGCYKSESGRIYWVQVFSK